MGTEFAIVYDLVVVAILIGMLFAGLKKGFASSVISLAAVFVAFACAMIFSEPITNGLYTDIVEKPVEEAVSSALDETMDTVDLAEISEIDYSMVMISGVAADDIEPRYISSSKAIIDLSDLDLSATGISKADLTRFGISEETDFSSVNAKTAEFTMTDIEHYGLGQMAVAQYIAVSMQKTELFDMFADFAAGVGEAVPVFFGTMSEEIVNGSVPALRSVVLVMLSTTSNAKDAVISGIVEPCVRIAVQTIAFAVIFIVVSILLNLLAKLLEFVNKIPVIGGLNSFCGGVVGVVQGLLTICIVCLAVRMVTVLTGGDIMFFNNAAIDSSIIFKYFYEIELLNFIG